MPTGSKAEAHGPAWRRLLGNLGVSAATCLLLLLGAEGALRVAGFAPERHRTRVRISRVGDVKLRANAGELDCYPSDPRGYFDVDLRRPADLERLRAEGYTDFSAALPESPWCVEFRFNRLGVRGSDFGPRRPGVTRVVVVGDSFTEGQGVRESDVYTSVLGALLEAARPGRYEVLNFGERALDFPELYALFERALELEPDLVVYGFVLNDADRSDEFDRLWPRLNDWIMVRRPDVRLRAWDSRLGALWRDRLEAARIARDTRRWYSDMYDDANRAGWSRTRDFLRRMQAAQQARGGRLLVAVWPLLVDLEGRYPFDAVHARIARACERAGIPQVDLLGALRGRESASLWAHPADWHPNEIAHRLAAQALAPEVLKLMEPRERAAAQR